MAGSVHQNSHSSDEMLEASRTPASLGRLIRAAETVGTNPEEQPRSPMNFTTNSTLGGNSLSASNSPSSIHPYNHNHQPYGVQPDYAPAPGFNNAFHSNQGYFSRNNVPADPNRALPPYHLSSGYNIPRGDRSRLAGHGRRSSRGRFNHSRGGNSYTRQQAFADTNQLVSGNESQIPVNNQPTNTPINSFRTMDAVAPLTEASTTPITRGQRSNGMYFKSRNAPKR
jgi:hypothetical protein